MQPIRRLLLRYRIVAGALFALALAMKLVMPAGFMPTLADNRIVVRICSGTAPMMMAMTIPGLETGDPAGKGQNDKPEQPCAFSGLSAPSLAAADPIILALAILFVLALGMRPLLLPVAQTPLRLRPPLRGPPAP